jgi:hypothetical protein
MGRVDIRRLVLVIAAITLACAALGLWLGNTVADDTGSIVLITLGCAVLGSFAPGTIRWIADSTRRDRTPR